MATSNINSLVPRGTPHSLPLSRVWELYLARSTPDRMFTVAMTTRQAPGCSAIGLSITAGVLSPVFSHFLHRGLLFAVCFILKTLSSVTKKTKNVIVSLDDCKHLHPKHLNVNRSCLQK